MNVMKDLRTIGIHRIALLALALLAVGTSRVNATTIFVPNGSFESPDITFAEPSIDSWQKAEQPFWYDPGMFNDFPWVALMGQFDNTTNGASDHIVNTDRKQLGYVFAVPGAAIFQDFNTAYTLPYSTNTVTPHDFIAQYEAGKSYTLTVGVLGGGGGMSPNATLQISLYYRDLSNNIVTVGATTITNTPQLFPTNTAFTDFQVRLPAVRANDAWAGKRIGIQIASTTDFSAIGGYWDLDNVRLTDNILPNYSFESPDVTFAEPFFAEWQKSAQPIWYDPGMFNDFPWFALAGQFDNTTNGAADHIVNLDGLQGGYMFAVPDLAIFQDYNNTGTNFNSRYEVGKSYSLTVGVLGGAAGMTTNATLQLSLYYRDNTNGIVTVAATTITNSPVLFPTNTAFVDFQVSLPVVRTNHAWAGKPIGVQIASTTGFGDIAGYWDFDNVRLVEGAVPNYSFEAPDITFAEPRMDSWQKAPQPFWYDPGMFNDFPWEYLMGQFDNTTNGASDHIVNTDGKQLGYIFAVPDAAIFQDYTTAVGTNAPTFDFNTRYEVGKTYSLTVGVLGGGGGMTTGATLQVSMYYRDGSNNMVTLAATTVVNSTNLFPTNTAFVDFQVVVPVVRSIDPWAGKHLGIKIASTLDFSMIPGGYWDFDNVRLRAVRDPFLKNMGVSGGQFQFTADSAPGRLEVLTATNIGAPVATWTSLGTITNLTGEYQFTHPAPISGQRFYHARQVP